jgi:hypothetical protein
MADGRRLGLDPASFRVAQRFLIAVPAISIWAVAIAPEHTMPMLATMMLFAATIDSLLAVLRRHVLNGPSLTYWDSCCGFFAVHCLARAFS